MKESIRLDYPDQRETIYLFDEINTELSVNGPNVWAMNYI